MTRFANCFKKVAKLDRPAYIPFLMLGDPSPPQSLQVIDAVIGSGIDALELGMPFSDPIADGPIVAEAAARACQHQLGTQSYFDMIQHIREKHTELPIGLLVYANLVFRFGITAFYQQAKQSGVDCVLIPDVPFIESAPYLQAGIEHGIEVVLLATPACQPSDLKNIAMHSAGFTYLVTRAGVTGIDKACQMNDAKAMVTKLNKMQAPPIVFGFGIKNASDVISAYQAGAKGVIIGSALIDALKTIDLQKEESMQKITALTRMLFTGESLVT
jgi:tryptophan synthase alpha chain